jgi:hypothetical protein
MTKDTLVYAVELFPSGLPELIGSGMVAIASKVRKTKVLQTSANSRPL